MLSELIFFQPFDDASGKSSVLVVAFGDEGLGCCDEKSGDQQGRENDSRTALSCLGGEQQHGLAIKTNPYPGRTAGKQRLLQMFVAETKLKTSQRGRGTAPPAQHHRHKQKRMVWHAISKRLKPLPGKLCVDGSRNDASIHQHERLRKGNSLT